MSHRSRSPSQRRRTRGIRGGPAARRRRLAYIDHRLAEGEIWDNIPVHHAGGQARPLFTSRYWSPTRSEESEQDLIGGEAEEEVVNLEVSSSEGEEVTRINSANSTCVSCSTSKACSCEGGHWWSSSSCEDSCSGSFIIEFWAAAT